MEDISLGVVIAQLINFGILFFIFYYFLGDKIIKIIEERRKQLSELEGSDEIVKQKMIEADEAAQNIIKEARLKAQEIQRNSEELSKKESNDKIKQAEIKAQSMLDGALRDVEKERLSMVSSLKEKILDYSLKVNAKLFGESQSHKDFIKKEVNSIKL